MSSERGPTTSGGPLTGKYSWKDGTEYEVKCQQTFAYYQGYVVDYDQETNKFHVCYENGWKPDERVNPSDIRPIAFNQWSMSTSKDDPEKWRDEWHPKEGEKVEAKAKSEENEPFGWWPCFIRCVKGEFFLINFEGWNDTHNEILGKEMLRPFNNKPALRGHKMTRHVVKMEDDPATIDWLRSRPPELEDVKQKSNLVHLFFTQANGNNELVLIGDKKSIKRTELLLNNTLEYRTELTKIRTDLDRVQKQLQEKEQQFRSAFKESFGVDVDLLPLVIGRKGKNIKDAESVQGVLKINVDDDGQVTIYAQNTDAAAEAREILEIISKDVQVPTSAMGRIIGAKGANIQKIVKDSQVIKIKSQPQKKSADIECLNIIGTSENVETATILIEAQLRHFEELDRLRIQQQQTQNELRDNYGGGGNYPNYGNSRGGGRNQGRGGGRQGRGRGDGQRRGRGGYNNRDSRGRGRGRGAPPRNDNKNGYPSNRQSNRQRSKEAKKTIAD